MSANAEHARSLYHQPLSGRVQGPYPTLLTRWDGTAVHGARSRASRFDALELAVHHKNYRISTCDSATTMSLIVLEFRDPYMEIR